VAGVAPVVAEQHGTGCAPKNRRCMRTLSLVGVRPPSGTVTFLFTDIEGSTRRWETDPETMSAALVVHDEVLSSAIEAHGGWLFKHTGDGVCAAFSVARAAVDAAVEAQRRLALPVRMGAATGEAEERDGDYFGPALNRAARVMEAGHGGQILVAASTASLVDGVELADLGEHRLRDLSGATRLFQVHADGLGVDFPRLRTLDAVPGNLPVQLTSFVGRDIEVKELIEVVQSQRLVTLTGVGGVGKTRLATQIAGELIPDHPDGVWLVELAPVGDPSAVPDAVASVLDITSQAGAGVTENIAQALLNRRALIVMDNCEHVLDAAAAVIEAILARTTTVTVIATSREGLRVGGEHVWSVPPLDVDAGAGSGAVALFVERAQAVVASFHLHDDGDIAAVAEICRRLDGIALAIELAAARMVSMTPTEVLERLTDRFRLLSLPQRGSDRHQTLRHAVSWSYDLLQEDERTVLNRCSVFAGGFDLAAAVEVCGDGELDQFVALNGLDSLVRKSLVSTERVNGHTRYGMLETIRKFAEEQLAASGTLDQVRDCHARYFADQAVLHRDIWDGPRQRVALDWVEVEFANLRAGFRWAMSQGEIVAAGAIAAQTAIMAFALQRYEPAGWAEEMLPAAAAADLRQLPRLYSAAGLCAMTGRVEAGIGYAEIAVAMEAEPRYDPFEFGWSSLLLATANAYAGQRDRFVEICDDLGTRPGFAHVVGLCGLVTMLPALGRADEAIAIAEEAVATARAQGNPFWICCALYGYGRAFANTDPHRARNALREGLAFAREHRIRYYEARIARNAAHLEASYGELEDALVLFETAIDSFHRAGDRATLATSLAYLAVLFERIERPEVAATIYGTSTNDASIAKVVNRPGAVARLQEILGDALFDECVAAGAAMEPADAVAYAREQIQTVRRHLADVT
jgi:predicted ATPase/class 3 adenylate cyclase